MTLPKKLSFIVALGCIALSIAMVSGPWTMASRSLAFEQDAEQATTGTVYQSSDLGWDPGANVSEHLSELLAKTFKPNDTLVLDDVYVVSGSELALPPGFTLKSEAGGGFDVLTQEEDETPLFVLVNRTMFEGVTLTAINAPDTGFSGTKPKARKHYHPKRLLLIMGDDVAIEDSRFDGNVAMFVDNHGGDRLRIENTSFTGGFYQVRLVGSADDNVITGSHFANALGDGIKTTRDGEYGPQRTQVLDSFFENNARDGIDTAGGFKDGYVADSVFYGNGVSGLDLKNMLERSEDLSLLNDNVGIVIENVEVIDSPNGVVVTMLDRIDALTADNADDLMPHDIVIRDSVFEQTPGFGRTGRAFLIKDGYNITWENIELRGRMHEVRIMNAEAPSGWSASNIGGNSMRGPARSDGRPFGERVSRFLCGLVRKSGAECQ